MISHRDDVKGEVLVSVCVLIRGKKYEILFIHEGDMPYYKLWVLPGGYIKPEETIKEAIVREVKEETGLNVTPTEFIGIYEDFLSVKDEPIHHIVIVYEVEIVGGKMIFSQEATAYKWLTVKEALSFPEIPNVFKKIVEGLGKKHLKKFRHLYAILTLNPEMQKL